MPGLVPGIHAKLQVEAPAVMRGGSAWMAGTSPAMTASKGEGIDRRSF
jgi:hypothetical protein